MKKSILFITLAVCSFQAIAQRDEDDDQVFKFGIGGSLQVPLGDLKQSTTYGVGFEATGVSNLASMFLKERIIMASQTAYYTCLF
jgi:hypothetical protein